MNMTVPVLIPFPPELKVCVPNPVPPFGLPSVKWGQTIGMIGVSEYQRGTWKMNKSKYVGFKTNSSSQSGCYTMGIETCIGVGMLFEGNGQAGAGLVHLSREVVRGQNGCDAMALNDILNTLCTSGRNTVGECTKIVLVLTKAYGDEQVIEEMTNRIGKVVDSLNTTSPRYCALNIGYDQTRMAADAVNKQLGPY